MTGASIDIALGIVAPETWPARYKLHKYWGRKPANVVARYIEFFTRAGDTVLDPFAGSGVTLVEGARLGRSVVGFDVNPVAVRLTNATLSPPRVETFLTAARAITESVRGRTAYLYATHCDACQTSAVVRSVGYVGADALEVRYRCPACGYSGAHAPSERDLALASRRDPLPAGAPDDAVLFGWEMQKLKRRSVQRWSDLFTHRNFLTASLLRQEILAVDDAATREWLMLSLTASLAQCTKMIADFSRGAGGPSWKINCYWLPKKWQELNPLWYFENRIAKSVDAIRDLVAQGAPYACGEASLVDSRNQPLADASIDYIFTDPPYGGEGIQYGELSMLWCLWLGAVQDLGAEVAFNPYRDLSQEHYADGLRHVFRECHRVLKPARWMTVTFANKDPVVWDALMNACREAGFELVTAAPMKRSAPSLTETTMHTAPKADLVLTFRKLAEPGRRLEQGASEYSLGESVARVVDALRLSGKTPDAHNVFDSVTIDWFSWFYRGEARPSSVRPTLANVEAVLRARYGDSP